MASPLTRRAFLRSLAAAGVLTLLPALAACVRKNSTDTLKIVPRSAWGAVEPDVQGSVEGPYDRLLNPGGWYVYERPLDQVLNTIVVHHSALPLTDGPAEIQHKHVHTRGFADIGYQFVIDAGGRVYEGRSLDVRGAHTGGHNTGTVGVVLLGNFEEDVPAEAQLVSLERLSRHLADTYGITHLAGHRDFQPEETVCPGHNLALLLPELAQEFGLAYGTEGYVGPP